MEILPFWLFSWFPLIFQVSSQILSNKDYLRPSTNQIVHSNVSFNSQKYLFDSKNHNHNGFLDIIVDLFKNKHVQYSDLVFFDGREAQRLFSPQNISTGVSLTKKLNVWNWRDLSIHINETFKLQQSAGPSFLLNGNHESEARERDRQIPKNSLSNQIKSVHLHNNFQIGDLLELVHQQHEINYGKFNSMKKHKSTGGLSPPLFREALDQGQPSIVITNSIDENWGFLSTRIENRTTAWINLTNHLLIHRATHRTVEEGLLRSDKVVLVIVNSHVDPLFSYQPKLLSLPLGVKDRKGMWSRMQAIQEAGRTKEKDLAPRDSSQPSSGKGEGDNERGRDQLQGAERGTRKSRWLLINNSGWKHRAEINEMVSRAFNGTVYNSYKKGSSLSRGPLGGPGAIVPEHYLDVAESRFVLCPSGLGYDTYRLWEALLLGSIPIVESNPGFDRTYARLPVLVVDHFSQVTPALLERAYLCFLKHADQFRFDHLLRRHWIQLIHQAIVSGSNEHVMEAHPFRNPYCDFLTTPSRLIPP